MPSKQVTSAEMANPSNLELFAEMANHLNLESLPDTGDRLEQEITKEVPWKGEYRGVESSPERH